MNQINNSPMTEGDKTEMEWKLILDNGFKPWSAEHYVMLESSRRDLGRWATEAKRRNGPDMPLGELVS